MLGSRRACTCSYRTTDRAGTSDHDVNSPERRIVRVAREVFEELEEVLGTERGPDGDACACDRRRRAGRQRRLGRDREYRSRPDALTRDQRRINVVETTTPAEVMGRYSNPNIVARLERMRVGRCFRWSPESVVARGRPWSGDCGRGQHAADVCHGSRRFAKYMAPRVASSLRVCSDSHRVGAVKFRYRWILRRRGG